MSLSLLLPLLPLVAFTVVEAYVGLRAGIAVAIGLSTAELAARWWRHGRVDRVLLASTALVIGLGGLGLLSEDERFVLVSPAIGDAVFAAGIAGAQLLGFSPLEAAMREQDPEADIPPALAAFLRGIGWRFAAVLLVHAGLVVWAAGQPRELWLLVSGPAQYALLGLQLAGEVAWGRLVVLPRLDAAAASSTSRADGPA